MNIRGEYDRKNMVSLYSLRGDKTRAHVNCKFTRNFCILLLYEIEISVETK